MGIGNKAKNSFVKAYEPSNFETDIYAAWEAHGIFLPQGIEGAGRFSIVMPPPNANGNLHIGHGLTVALEDSLTRYYRLRGKATWYVPGADHAGFETWVVYERELEKAGQTRFNYTREELYAQVWSFVEQQRGNMELQLRALGASCSWKDLTFTLDENVVRRVYATFEKMWKDGMVYRGEKLVNFCPKHQTAFADIEVVHEEEPGKLWEIAYRVVGADFADGEDRSSQGAVGGGHPTPTARGAAVSPDADASESSSPASRPPLTEIIVSTTRPETLFGDTAVAVNPNDARYKDLIGKSVALPLTNREIPVIADEHANPEYGTGAVKITPAHDFDDFEVGERHNLPRVTVIGFDGRMLEAAGPDYAGLTTLECREKVLRDLETAGLLRGEQKISHAVAHCYKCGSVIEPLLKEQWFVDTEKLAAVAIEHLEAGEIKFFPATRQKVLVDYLKGLKDWNISRQIPWGIAIPMFKRVEQTTQIQNTTSSAHSRPFGQANGLGSSVPEFEAPEWVFDTRTHLKEIEVGGVRYVRDEDTFDTWFSSAHWPIVCTNWEEGFPNPYYPLNVMETGADILFAWVARMVMMGLYVTGEVPFREVYLHGLVLDEYGKKMSKSKGNVINPMELVGKYGSDAFRLGILRGRSAGMNQAFSENAVVSGRNLCNKLWNISRFIQGLVDQEMIEKGFSVTAVDTNLQQGESDAAHATEANVADESSSDRVLEYTTNNIGEDWICRELDRCRSMVEQAMAEYRFAEAVEILYSTIWDKYADWFVESQKIYKNIPLLKVTLEMILVMLHPFAPFVTEAIWQNLSWTEDLIMEQRWPARLAYDEIAAVQFEKLMVIVSEVRGTLQTLSEAHKGKNYGLLYGDDSLVNDNSLLVQFLCRVPSIAPTDGAPRGLRIALPNNEVYLDVSAEVVAAYREALEQRILAVGREVDSLNARMMNPRYVERAPAGLVKETREQIAEKNSLIERLKQQLSVI